MTEHLVVIGTDGAREVRVKALHAVTITLVEDVLDQRAIEVLLAPMELHTVGRELGDVGARDLAVMAVEVRAQEDLRANALPAPRISRPEAHKPAHDHAEGVPVVQDERVELVISDEQPAAFAGEPLVERVKGRRDRERVRPVRGEARRGVNTRPKRSSMTTAFSMLRTLAMIARMTCTADVRASSMWTRRSIR
jgi:hypothetical protein